MVDDADATSGGSGADDDAVDLEDAVDRFLSDTGTALGEYDQGYADADATLSVLRTHLSELRDAVDEE